MKIEVTIFIPTVSNDSQVFDPAHHAQFEQELLSRFGGFHRKPGLAHGAWIDGGVVYPDQLRVYVVAVDSLLGAATDILAAADYAKMHYSQLAIYVAYQGFSEVL